MADHCKDDAYRAEWHVHIHDQDNECHSSPVRSALCRLTIPVFFCLGFASILAIILILSNGVGYFVLAIGPKGTRRAETDNTTLLDNNATA
jgi:hypothetical protein